MEDEESQQTHMLVRAQGITTLPFLSDEIPVLYLTNGRPYIPVCAVCQVFGIDAHRHIRRWRNLLLWVTAQKLPYQTPRGKRLVWCLLISEIPYLYGLFNWDLVSPERRKQLRVASEQGIVLANEAYQSMQRHYKKTRQELFVFLTETDGMEQRLTAMEAQTVPQLHPEVIMIFAELIGRGLFLYQETICFQVDYAAWASDRGAS